MVPGLTGPPIVPIEAARLFGQKFGFGLARLQTKTGVFGKLPSAHATRPEFLLDRSSEVNDGVFVTQSRNSQVPVSSFLHFPPSRLTLKCFKSPDSKQVGEMGAVRPL